MSLVDLTPSPTQSPNSSHEEKHTAHPKPSHHGSSTQPPVKNAAHDNVQSLQDFAQEPPSPTAHRMLDESSIVQENSPTAGSAVAAIQHLSNTMTPATDDPTTHPQQSVSGTANHETLSSDLKNLSFDEDSSSAPVAKQSTSPPQPLPKDEKYLRPLSSSSSIASRKASPVPPTVSGRAQDEWTEKEPYEDKSQSIHRAIAEGDFDDKARGEGETTEESRAEISSIIEQFTGDKASNNSVTSPPRDTQGLFPPRVSSLEHLTQPALEPGENKVEELAVLSPTSSHRDPERSSVSYAGSIKSQAPPPEPDPEPDLPFEFHRFIEQLRLRAADPVAKFLRSFLQEFGKKQWQVHEQVKIISDFLTFISNRMAQCDVWRNASEAEFDNAREGMEKLVMNRLYTQTFSPEIPPSEPSPVKGRRKGTSTPLGTGRKGQHQEDVERDEVLAQKIRIYGWLREEHLDMKPFNEKGRKFLLLAQQELAKIKSYRAPRDKVICVLNSCKVIFGYLRNAQSDQSADTFIPLLIYTVLKANPDHLVSNLQYILRFRNQDKLGGEAGYYISSLMGAVQFIENLDRTNITVSDEEFDKNVEAAVSEIAARNEQEEKRHTAHPAVLQAPLIPEKPGPSRPETVQPPQTADSERSNQRRTTLTSSSDEQSSDEKAAVSGLLRTIQRPLSTIGRIFSDEATATIISPGGGNTADRPPATPRPSPRPDRVPGQPPNSSVPPGAAAAENRTRLRAEDAAALQASAEAAEAHTIMRAEHHTVVETLSGMFPDLDPEIISDVVRMKEGRIGLAVDACLVLSR